MLDAFDFGQHLFHRHGNEVLDFGRARARKRHEDIGKRHVDLGFFFARRDSDGEHAHQQAGNGQQRRYLRVLELACQRTRQAQRLVLDH